MYPCGRESRPAAAALGALVLALVSTAALPRGALSQGLALPPLAPPRRNTTCDNVPYPFGVRGNKYLPGFEVVCGPNKEAMLPIGDQEYRIDSVSPPDSFVVIFAGPVRQVCYDHHGKPTPDTGTAGPMSLERTPFTFSKRNKLVNVGCNRTLIANFTNPPGDPRPWPSANCTTHCKGVGDSIISGYCSGEEACCEIPIPEQVNGAQAFTPSFIRTDDRDEDATAEEYNTCSAAFFLDKSEQAITFDGGDDDGRRPLDQVLLQPGKRRMILDWAIGSSTCDQAQAYNLDPSWRPCQDTCVDAPSGVGYLCKCRQGYNGNPYASNGCQDINECRDQNTNNCMYLNLCNNTDGGYTCSCPANTTGDGYKNGTGCNPDTTTYGSPMQQPQGINVCRHPEKNPCKHQKYCTIDFQGVASCACPQGMSGDGHKMGSGCQKHFPVDTALGNLLNTWTTTLHHCICFVSSFIN